MAAAGQGNVRGREGDECDWFHSCAYKFRRMNWTYEDTGPVAMLPPQQDVQQQVQQGPAPEEQQQQQQPDLVIQDTDVDMEVDTDN